MPSAGTAAGGRAAAPGGQLGGDRRRGPGLCHEQTVKTTMTMKAAVCVAAGERRGSDSLWRIGRRSPAPQGWLCPPRGPCRGRNDKSLSPWAQKETASPMSQPEARGPSREEARYPGRRARREYGHGGDGVPVGLEVALRGPQATSTVPCFRRRPLSSRPGTATWRVLTSEQALLPRRPCGGAWLW